MVDALTGSLLALTDSRSCAGERTAVPRPAVGNLPGAATISATARASDRHHRWPDGRTGADNLVGYCTGHHRGKHQAPGWRHDLATDGTLTVATPTGLVASTWPPPY